MENKITMPDNYHLVDSAKVYQLLTAGNASLVFHNTESGNHRTYKVKRAKSGWYYVTHNLITIASFKLTEPDNRYIIGTLNSSREYPEPEYTNDDKKSIEERAKFLHLFYLVYYNKLPAKMLVYHTGICCACGRELTDPESIIIGLGPTCRGK